MHDLLQPLVDWYLSLLDSAGYPLIALLMAVESSFVPLPSELIIPPAVALAEHGRFTLWGVVLAGAIGSWAGASFMYWGARWVGTPLLMRFGRYFFMSPEKLESAHNWAERYGAMGVFFARLLPGVRHLIGIPCGLVTMNYRVYSLFTLIGSGLWCGVLYYVGVAAKNDPKLMAGELHQITLWVVGALVILGGLTFLVTKLTAKIAPR